MQPIRFLLLAIAMFPLFSTAQNNYMDGYFITNANDTVRGSINYLEWYNNPEKFNFKTAPGSAITEVTVNTAKEVTIIGYATYQRFETLISMNSLQLTELTTTEGNAGISKTVFLKQLLKGNRLNLYSFADGLKQRFYIVEANKNVPEELLYAKKLQDMQEQTIYTFRTQLMHQAVEYSAYTADLQNKIQNAEYNEAALKIIAGSINTRNETIEHNRQNANSYFAGLGVMHATIRYTGTDLITADRLDENGANRFRKITITNVTPRIAAGINFYSKAWPRRWGIKTELSAYQFSSTIISYTKYNQFSPAENQYTFNLKGWCFTLNPQAIYKFYSDASLKAYAAAGLGFHVLTTSKNSIYKLGFNQPLTFNETVDDYFPLKKFNFSLTGRVGVVLKDKIDLYFYGSSPIQYNAGNPEDFSVKCTMLALCAAYNF